MGVEAAGGGNCRNRRRHLRTEGDLLGRLGWPGLSVRDNRRFSSKPAKTPGSIKITMTTATPAMSPAAERYAEECLRLSADAGNRVRVLRDITYGSDPRQR